MHQNPYKAQEVTNRLATLFITESIKARESQVEDAVDFLVTQVRDARAELEAKEEALRRFKEARMGRLPEQLNTNIATMQMLQQELRTVEESLLFARERRAAGPLWAADHVPAAPRAPHRPPLREDLSTLRRQLASMRGRYTDEHPDVQNLRSRIARLEASIKEDTLKEPSDAGTPMSTLGGELQRRTRRSLASRQGDRTSRAAWVACEHGSTTRLGRSRS